MSRFLIFVLFLSVGAIGCGKKETVILESPKGVSVSTNSDGNAPAVPDGDAKETTPSTISKGATTTVGPDKVSELDLGIAFYPGSIEPDESMSSKIEDKDEKVVISIRNTKDSPGKVVEFYSGRVKNPAKSAVAGGRIQSSSLQGRLESGADISIAATKDGDQDTQILVTVTHKK